MPAPAAQRPAARNTVANNRTAPKQQEKPEPQAPQANKYGLANKPYTAVANDNFLFATTISGFKAEGNKISLLPIYANTAKGESFRFKAEIDGEVVSIFASPKLRPYLAELAEGEKVSPADVMLYTLTGDDGEPFTLMGKIGTPNDDSNIDWD